MAPDSGPHQDQLLLMVQSVVSQKLCCCYQGIFIFLGQRHVGGLMTADDDWAPAARPQVGGTVPAVLGRGNLPGAEAAWKIYPPGTKHFQLSLPLFHKPHWAVEVTFVHGTATGNRKREQAFFFLFQVMNALGILASWLFQAVIWITWIGNVLLQPCTSQGENCN